MAENNNANQQQTKEKKAKVKERVAIFIDRSNFYHSSKKLNALKIDFVKLTNVLNNERNLVSVFYYNSPLDFTKDRKRYWKQQKFFDKLRKLPFFKVILSKMRRYSDGEIEKYMVKGDDVHLAVDLISGAYENLYDVAVVVSGDEDFIPALNKLKKLGKKIENAYFISSSSAALKNTSNISICLDNIIKKIINCPVLPQRTIPGNISNN